MMQRPIYKERVYDETLCRYVDLHIDVKRSELSGELQYAVFMRVRRHWFAGLFFGRGEWHKVGPTFTYRDNAAKELEVLRAKLRRGPY